MNTANTEKLYLDDPYQMEFRASVLSASPRGKAGTAVVLDRSFFYPESGGQTSDRGLLGGYEVVDVQEGEAESVVHIVQGDGEPAGEVECRVDWPRRFDHMQQHTGQHVLSRAFIETADLHTVSFHMGDDTCTIDLEGPSYDEDTARRAEERANGIIEENRSVLIRTVPIDELGEGELRRKVPEGVTSVRLVEVDGVDVIPCCGTHVSATGELRLIKVLKMEKVKGSYRVSFKVGRRAIADYRDKHDIVSALANRLTTSGAEIARKVDKLSDENQLGKKAIRRLARKLAVVEKDLLIAGAEPVGQHRLIAQRIPDADADYLRVLAGEIKTEPGVVALLASGDNAVICFATEGVTIDLSAAVELARAMGGSGGGKGAFAQFLLPRDADLESFMAHVEEDVRQRL